MLRANLYTFGNDPETDRAIKLFPRLDAFLTELNQGICEDDFQTLSQILKADLDTNPPQETDQTGLKESESA